MYNYFINELINTVNIFLKIYIVRISINVLFFYSLIKIMFLLGTSKEIVSGDRRLQNAKVGRLWA